MRVKPARSMRSAAIWLELHMSLEQYTTPGLAFAASDELRVGKPASLTPLRPAFSVEFAGLALEILRVTFGHQ